MTKGFLLAAAVGASVLSPFAAAAQDTITLKFLTAWDSRFEGTRFIAQKYAAMVEEASKGRIKFRFSGPEVVKPRQQFEPVSQGVFDLYFTTPVYFLGTTGVPMAFYAMPPDTELWRKRGYWAYVDKEFGRFSQKLVGLYSAGRQSNFYQLMLKKPLGPGDQPLKGLKIRGNVFYKPLVAPLGGSLVNLDIGQIYSALEKGVVDGAASPVLGTSNFKLHEVAKYMMRPRFGLSPFTLSMNQGRFNKLSKANQDLLLKVARELEQKAPDVFDAAAEEEVAKLKKFGVKETQLDPKLFEKVNKGFLKGVWNIAINFNKKTKARVQALYEMAKKNGDAE